MSAGMALIGIVFVVAHYAIFSSFFANPKMWENQKQGPPPAEFFAIMKWFYLLGLIWFVSAGALNVISGLFIRARKYRTFSIVIAGMNCIRVPLGTVLGVFTMIVMLRDSVRELYEPPTNETP